MMGGTEGGKKRKNAFLVLVFIQSHFCTSQNKGLIHTTFLLHSQFHLGFYSFIPVHKIYFNHLLTYSVYILLLSCSVVGG